MRDYFVYILSNKTDSTLYIGVTNDLLRRVWEHKEKSAAGFTAKYNVNKLVYYEVAGDVDVAIAREKQLKGWNRRKKEALIDTMNPEREDLWESIL